MKNILGLIVVLTMVILGSGCADDEEEVFMGSCAGPTMSDKSKACLEYVSSEELKEWRMACTRVMRGTWSDSECNSQGALGGCQFKNKNTVWLFPSEKDHTVEQVSAFCTEKDGKFLEPDR